MLNSFLWGLLATSSLVIGGLIASHFSLSKKAVGIIMAFGAGTLISAVSYELIYEAVILSRESLYAMFGFFAGALTYYFQTGFWKILVQEIIKKARHQSNQN